MKSYAYAVTFDVEGHKVVLSVFASCVGNAMCVARGQLSDAEYLIAKLVSVVSQ
jgi:hypothetical protein